MRVHASASTAQLTDPAFRILNASAATLIDASVTVVIDAVAANLGCTRVNQWIRVEAIRAVSHEVRRLNASEDVALTVPVRVVIEVLAPYLTRTVIDIAVTVIIRPITNFGRHRVRLRIVVVTIRAVSDVVRRLGA